MHKVNIPKHVQERALLQRNGKEHLFETLDMEKVAHVIVDLQVGFVAEGAPVEVPVTREIFGEVNSVSRAVRETGGLNVFLRFTYDGDEKLPWNVWFSNYMSPSQFEITKKAFARGAIKACAFEFGGCNIDTRTYLRDFWFFLTERNYQIATINPLGAPHPIPRYHEGLEHFTATNYVAWRRDVAG